MKLSIVIEDGQIDATGKTGRAMMAELKTEDKGYEKIWAASWLDRKDEFRKHIEAMIKDMKKMRKEELKNKDVAQKVAKKATDKLIK